MLVKFNRIAKNKTSARKLNKYKIIKLIIS